MSAKNRILSEEETEEQKEYTERVGRISAEFEQTHGRKPRFFPPHTVVSKMRTIPNVSTECCFKWGTNIRKTKTLPT